MSHLMIRSIVRNIILETRGPLAFIPILKEWINVAARDGEEVDPYIKGPSRRAGQVQARAQNASLKVPSEHAHKVFENSSPDLQEYILKHWRSKEYFAAMISGVTLGIIKEYEQRNYLGMKSGTTMIQGAINDEGKMVGSMSGYLTAKIESNWTWQSDNHYANNRCILNKTGEINRDQWKSMLMGELKKRNGSTMVHEFQHWFQESIYYAETGQMTPTKRKGKRNHLPEPRETKPNLMDLQPIQLMFAKKAFDGVDWGTTMQIRGATAYKLVDPEKFFDSYNPQKDKNNYQYASLERNAFKDLSKQETRDLIEVVMYDYLKLQKHLSPDDLDKLTVEAMNERYWNLRSSAQKMMWDKGHEVSSFIHQQNSYGVTVDKEKLSAWDGNTRDTPKGSGEKTVQGTDSLFKSIGIGVHQIDILKSTDFDKKGNLKPGRQPSKPTPSGVQKAEWVLITGGPQKLPRRKAGSGEWDLERKRGTRSPGFGRGEWTDRWVEFDAVASEYMVSEVLDMFQLRAPILRLLVKGDAENFAKNLGDNILHRVHRRGFNHARMKDENRKHIESLAERITDRLIETIEENPFEEWFDRTNTVPLSQRKFPDFFDKWVTGTGNQAPTGSADYWEFIFAKASGENV